MAGTDFTLPSLSEWFANSNVPSSDQAMAMLAAGDFNNMSTLQWDALQYSLNLTQTGCIRKGAIPLALATNATCLSGFSCPKSSDEEPPQYCPPTEKCQILRDNQGTCSPQGRLEPQICGNGFYCPLGGKQQLDCPNGTYCPQGTLEPIKCDFGAYCPNLSSRQIELVPLFLVIAMDLVLALAVVVGFGLSKIHKRRGQREYITLRTRRSDDDIELLKRPSMSMTRSPGHSRQLSLGADIPVPTRTRSPSQHLGGFMEAPYPSRGRSVSVSSDNGVLPRAAFPSYSISDFGSPGLGGYSYEDTHEAEDDYHGNPDMQRFLRSLSSTVHTEDVGLSFDFEKLSCEVKGKKKILSGITGSISRGSMCGVMGGSGAGKSTFLNCLMGKAQHTGGSIKINGWEKDMSKYKKLVGYVPQDDIVLPELTVRENILHSARCRLPSSWRDSNIRSFVDSLISCLALTHVQHSRVGDARKPVISGGQRKRVSIGIELAAAPMAIFLDEPTSGLDSTSARSIMQLLKAISGLGVTTIAIIHQPREEIFSAFDSLLLLGQGRQIYHGPTEDVQNYFTSLGFAFPPRGNPADTVMDIINGDGLRYTYKADRHETDVPFLIYFWGKNGQRGKMGKHLSVEAKRVRRTSNSSMQSTSQQEKSLHLTMKARGAAWPAQVYYCWKRAMIQQVRNGSSFVFEIGVGALAGGIIGLSAFSDGGHLFQGVYYPPFTLLSSAVNYISIPQLGLLSAMAIGLAASAPGVRVFGEEKMIYWREAASGQSRTAYYIGKVLSTIPRFALSALHYSVFLGVLATPLMSFTDQYWANLTYFYAVYGFSSMISMVVKREDGPLLAVLASLIIGILGGVAPPLSKVKSWHVEPLWRMSPGVWYTESWFSQNLLPLNHIYMIDLAAKSVGFTLGQYKLDIIMLFVIGTVYRIVAFLGLIFVDRQRQR